MITSSIATYPASRIISQKRTWGTLVHIDESGVIRPDEREAFINTDRLRGSNSLNSLSSTSDLLAVRQPHPCFYLKGDRSRDGDTHTVSSCWLGQTRLLPGQLVRVRGHRADPVSLSTHTSSREHSPTAGSMATQDRERSAKWSPDAGRRSGVSGSAMSPAMRP